MSIFDDEESIILNKGILAARDRQLKSSNNPFDYGRISNNDQSLLEYDDKNRMQKVQDLALSFGPGAIQKIGGGGQVFGKFAKAVRKYMIGKRKFSDSSDILGVARINDGNQTIQAVIKDMNVKTKYPYDNALKSSNLKSGVHGYTTSAPNMDNYKNYQHVQEVVVRNDIKPYNSTMHELGHVVDYSKDISPNLNLGPSVPKYYHEKPSEIFAEAFSKVNNYPTTNVALGKNADFVLLNDNLKNLLKSYKVNIYPK